MFTITVPASSANIGPGFDSAGVAVSRYLTLDVERATNWKFTHTTDTIPEVANYEDHYIYKVAKTVADGHTALFRPTQMKMTSEIQISREVGSSASTIVAVIELANQLCHLHLSEKEKLDYAVRIEGHPDNVVAALLGGFVV